MTTALAGLSRTLAAELPSAVPGSAVLIEGWVQTVVTAALGDRIPGAAALAETLRRRRATGGPAEQTFATLVGLELRADINNSHRLPRLLRQRQRGTSGGRPRADYEIGRQNISSSVDSRSARSASV